MSRRSNLDKADLPSREETGARDPRSSKPCAAPSCQLHDRATLPAFRSPTSEPASARGFDMPSLIADRAVLRMTSELGQVMAAARAREQAGERVLHLERGEPDFDTPPHIVEALAAAARAGETHYPDARGDRALREALVEKLARENQLTVEPDDIVVTDGGTHGLFLTFQGLLSPGDEVLVLSPHW